MTQTEKLETVGKKLHESEILILDFLLEESKNPQFREEYIKQIFDFVQLIKSLKKNFK